jgi:hypothetical protein
LPVAVNFNDVPFCMRPLAGEIVMETSFTVETVSVVELLTAPSMAVIVVLPVERLVTRPRLVMVATAGVDELHRTDRVMSCVELSSNVPMALNCLVASSGIAEFSGAIPRDTSFALLTVTGVLADTVPDTTLTVELPGPTASPSPLASSVRTPVELDDHNADLSTCVLPSSKLPVAVNCCCVPGAMVRFAGVSVMDCRCAATTVITEESVKVPTVAVMVVAPAASVVARPFASTVATLVSDEVQVTPVTKS